MTGKIYHAQEDKEKKYGYFLRNDNVSPPVPPGRKYKDEWKDASIAMRRMRVRNFVVHMYEKGHGVGAKDDATRKQPGNERDRIDALFEKSAHQIGENAKHHRELQGEMRQLVEEVKEFKNKQQADVDDLQKQVNQLCGFMRGMKIDGLQEQMGQTSMSEHAGRTKAVKWAVVEEDD